MRCYYLSTLQVCCLVKSGQHRPRERGNLGNILKFTGDIWTITHGYLLQVHSCTPKSVCVRVSLMGAAKDLTKTSNSNIWTTGPALPHLTWMRQQGQLHQGRRKLPQVHWATSHPGLFASGLSHGSEVGASLLSSRHLGEKRQPGPELCLLPIWLPVPAKEAFLSLFPNFSTKQTATPWTVTTLLSGYHLPSENSLPSTTHHQCLS